jgi:hypothetical protein
MQKKNATGQTAGHTVQARGLFASELPGNPFTRAAVSSATQPAKEEGRGRPPRTVQELSDRRIILRVTKRELASLRRRAAAAKEPNLSNYVRSFLPLDEF